MPQRSAAQGHDMDILSIIRLLGGVGLFLFGMDLMGSYLTALAGSSLAQILERLTTSKNRAAGYLKGFGLGTGVTAIIQSSAATTIMLIGFVNAGIMRVSQALPVVFGANVGSTVTAQILRLGDLSSDMLIFQLLKPSTFAPILVGVGAFMHLFMKSKRAKNIAGILAGLGLLFYGMTMMEAVFEPLREMPAFQRLFTSFRNPIIGILTGLAVTAIIQSSSASVGILQALSATGAVSFEAAWAIIIGQNIGKCFTILLGTLGTGRKAKRVGAGYLIFNLFGAVFFTVLLYLALYLFKFPFMGSTVNRGIIANMHLGFNLITSIILLPLTRQIAKLTKMIFGKEKVDPMERLFMRLDDRLLDTPSVALTQCENLMREMCVRINENYRGALELLKDFKPKRLEELEENEAFIDRCETVLSSYMIRIDRKRLRPEQSRHILTLLNSVSDFERIGDYCISIGYIAREMMDAGKEFSDAGKYEISLLSAACSRIIDTLQKAFDENDPELASQLEPLSDVMEELTAIVKSNHIGRLSRNLCSVEAGISLNDLLTCFERISAHASNIALHIYAKNSDGSFDDRHGHSMDKSSPEYQELLDTYRDMYLRPLNEPLNEPLIGSSAEPQT